MSKKLDEIYESADKLPRFWSLLLVKSNWIFNKLSKFLKRGWTVTVTLWCSAALLDKFIWHVNQTTLESWPLVIWFSLVTVLLCVTVYFQTILAETYANAFLFLRIEGERYISGRKTLVFFLCIVEVCLVFTIGFLLWKGLVITKQILTPLNGVSLVVFAIWIIILFLCDSKMQKEDDYTNSRIPNSRKTRDL